MGQFKEEIFYQVIQSLLEGHTVEETSLSTGVSRKTISEYIKKLQDPKSKYYNPKYYDSILFIRETKYGEYYDKDLLEEIVTEIYNGQTLKEIALNKGKSVETIKLYLKALKDENHPFYNPDLDTKIAFYRQKYQYYYNRIGGFIGKRGKEHTEEEIKQLALQLIHFDEVLESLSCKTNIPKSTIYDNIRSIQDEEIQHQLDVTFESHRHHK